ncbi:MAG: NADH-quinone oxidoreductase subunit D [Chthonomonadetes bacterium]|nr:NADH-quinone oxidoreductase subunit D [Chthonomonadetes bacterium]
MSITPEQMEILPGAAEGSMVINMGPQHPSTHGVLRLVVELDGETIVDVVPHIGYLHTGIEKTCEHEQYQKCIPLVERMDYLSAMNNSLAFVLSVEKLLDIQVPPRGVWLRMIFSELQRIASHLVWLGTHALDIGAMTPFFYCFRERERILDMFEHLSGVRMFPSWIQVGGWRADVPEGLLEKIAKFVEEFPAKVDDYEGLLTENPIWIERTRNIGIITADECIALGINGPILRGSGYAYDIRKANPYLYYDQVQFDIPTGTVGDVYDRFLVRVEEMRQAARIIKQCLERIPEGPVSSGDRKVVPPPREELDNSMESLIHHFKLWTEGFRPPEGEAYVPIEGPKGEIGYYVVSDGSNRPWRVKTRPPCFMNLQALAPMSKGHMIADIVAIIGSIDIVLGEIDR